jgi:hypothetical protein
MRHAASATPRGPCGEVLVRCERRSADRAQPVASRLHGPHVDLFREHAGAAFL